MKTARLFSIVVLLSVETLAIHRAHAEGLVEALVRRFSESDFQFVRGKTNQPFLPLAWVDVSDYAESRFTGPENVGATGLFEQSALSEGAFVPLPLGKRDMAVVGEWVSQTRFRFKSANEDVLDILSVSIPVGWAHQASRDWQVAAFVAPLGHRSAEDSWYWETLGGVFARYLQSDQLAWIFGGYFDVSPFEKFYIPYVGFTYAIDERWVINAVMPWPGVTYAPDEKTLFRLGVLPSGTSWTAEANARHPRFSLSAWNFGLSAQRRFYKDFWFGAEVGVSGIRGVSITDSGWQGVDTKLDSTGYILLTINFRPGALPAAESE